MVTIKVNGQTITIKNKSVENISPKSIESLNDEINKDLTKLSTVCNVKVVEAFGYKATEGFGDKVKNVLKSVIEKIKEFIRKIVIFLKTVANKLKGISESIQRKKQLKQLRESGFKEVKLVGIDQDTKYDSESGILYLSEKEIESQMTVATDSEEGHEKDIGYAISNSYATFKNNYATVFADTIKKMQQEVLKLSSYIVKNKTIDTDLVDLIFKVADKVKEYSDFMFKFMEDKRKNESSISLDKKITFIVNYPNPDTYLGQHKTSNKLLNEFMDYVGDLIDDIDCEGTSEEIIKALKYIQSSMYDMYSIYNRYICRSFTVYSHTMHIILIHVLSSSNVLTFDDIKMFYTSQSTIAAWEKLKAEAEKNNDVVFPLVSKSITETLKKDRTYRQEGKIVMSFYSLGSGWPSESGTYRSITPTKKISFDEMDDESKKFFDEMPRNSQEIGEYIKKIFGLN